ncbi:MAG: hypothetical protein CM15mV27_0840 [Caudoviricetes sp.]|nr:MAG: hypothetical protein CM15mV27_0840 [Caudoviricetes sp.]
MSDVKVIRLSTGEDVIAKVDEGSEKVTPRQTFCNYSSTNGTW